MARTFRPSCVSCRLAATLSKRSTTRHLLCRQMKRPASRLPLSRTDKDGSLTRHAPARSSTQPSGGEGQLHRGGDRRHRRGPQLPQPTQSNCRSSANRWNRCAGALHDDRVGRDDQLTLGSLDLVIAVNESVHDALAGESEQGFLRLTPSRSRAVDRIRELVPEPLQRQTRSKNLWTIEVPWLFVPFRKMNRAQQAGLGHGRPRLFAKEQKAKPRWRPAAIVVLQKPLLNETTVGDWLRLDSRNAQRLGDDLVRQPHAR